MSYTIDIAQGERLELPITYTDDNGVPVNITGWTAKLQLRASLGAALPIVALTEAATTVGQLVLGANGTVTIDLSTTTTTGLEDRAYFYDLFLYSATGRAIPLLDGLIRVRQAVTR